MELEKNPVSHKPAKKLDSQNLLTSDEADLRFEFFDFLTFIRETMFWLKKLYQYNLFNKNVCIGYRHDPK